MKTLLNLLTLIGLGLSVFNSAFASDTEIRGGHLDAAFSSWGSASLKGDWKIVEADDKTFIELNENFKAKEGPDVKIFLSPLRADEVTGDNATQGSVFITQISSFEGKDRIEIPVGTDLSDFQSLVFHCEAYSKLWGTSALASR